jgi:hypothetical protein
MIKFEMHVHAKGGSRCGRAEPETIVQDFIKGGYGGIVITNHYDEYNYFNTLVGETHKQKIDSFFSLYDTIKELGEKQNLKVFYGVEVRDCLNDEYMLYGFKREFLYDNKPLFTYSQKELFSMAEKNNMFMYQTHPFRDGVRCGNPEYMHGAEIFNGHFHHVNNNDRAKEFFVGKKLIRMAGIDYHVPNQPLTASMQIPKDVNDEFALVEYLMSGKAEYFGDEEYYLEELQKYKGIK